MNEINLENDWLGGLNIKAMFNNCRNSNPAHIDTSLAIKQTQFAFNPYFFLTKFIELIGNIYEKSKIIFLIFILNIFVFPSSSAAKSCNIGYVNNSLKFEVNKFWPKSYGLNISGVAKKKHNITFLISINQLLDIQTIQFKRINKKYSNTYYYKGILVSENLDTELKKIPIAFYLVRLMTINPAIRTYFVSVASDYPLDNTKNNTCLEIIDIQKFFREQ